MSPPNRTSGRSSAHRRAPRLSPDLRERSILDGAVAFFADHGFDATTRDLAQHLGITQSLLYRYFPTKQKLVERVYRHVFVERWNPEWPAMISNRQLPLLQRLETFYLSYIEATLTRQWMRLFYYAGLKGFDFNSRYLRLLRSKIFVPICGELRAAYGIPVMDSEELSDLELELVYGFHGSVIYRGIRQHIYGLEVDPDPRPQLRIWLDAFVNHASAATYRKLAAERLISA